MVVVAEVHSHGALLQAVTAQRRSQQHAHVAEGAIVLVVVEVIRGSVVGDIEIRPAVIVVIDTTANYLYQAIVMVWIANPGFAGHFLERAVVAVVKQQVAFAWHAPGTALHLDSLV